MVASFRIKDLCYLHPSQKEEAKFFSQLADLFSVIEGVPLVLYMPLSRLQVQYPKSAHGKMPRGSTFNPYHCILQYSSLFRLAFHRSVWFFLFLQMLLIIFKVIFNVRQFIFIAIAGGAQEHPMTVSDLCLDKRNVYWMRAGYTEHASYGEQLK